MKNNFKTYYVGKVVIYDTLFMLDENSKEQSFDNIVDIKTLVAGPNKEVVIEMLVDYIKENFGIEDKIEIAPPLINGKKFEKPENGYIFQIDEVLAPSIMEVL